MDIKRMAKDELFEAVRKLQSERDKLRAELAEAKVESEKLRKAIKDVPYDAYYIENWKREALKGSA
jgi:cell division protein FtsB